DVSSAHLRLWVENEAVASIQATLHGSFTFDDLYAYMSHRLGQPRGPYQSLHQSWWGNYYCRVGPWWADGCGASVAIEGATLGHPLALVITSEGASERPPNNGVQRTGSAPSSRTGQAQRALRGPGR